MSEETGNALSYPDFRADYEQRFPSKVPKRRVVISAYPGWLAPVVFLMFASAAVLSGVHTIPTVYATIENTMPEWVRIGAASISFIAVEIAIFTSAYLMLTKDSRAWARWLLILTGAVAVIANLYSSSKAFTEQGDAGVILVAYLMGFCMPLIALVSGKLFVNIHRATRQIQTDIEQEYQAALIMFDELVNAEFEKARHKQDRRTRRTPVRRVSASDGQNGQNGHSTGQGYSKQMDAQGRVRAYLEANPEAFEMSVRALADELNVGKSTVADVRRLMQTDTPVSTNGHHA